MTEERSLRGQNLKTISKKLDKGQEFCIIVLVANQLNPLLYFTLLYSFIGLSGSITFPVR